MKYYLNCRDTLIYNYCKKHKNIDLNQMRKDLKISFVSITGALERFKTLGILLITPIIKHDLKENEEPRQYKCTEALSVDDAVLFVRNHLITAKNNYEKTLDKNEIARLKIEIKKITIALTSVGYIISNDLKIKPRKQIEIEVERDQVREAQLLRERGEKMKIISSAENKTQIEKFLGDDDGLVRAYARNRF